MVRGAEDRRDKETTMLKIDLKATASAVAALALTVVMSWTFVDATTLTNLTRDGASYLAALSVLVG
jgi:hypothetical protein